MPCAQPTTSAPVRHSQPRRSLNTSFRSSSARRTPHNSTLAGSVSQHFTSVSSQRGGRTEIKHSELIRTDLAEPRKQKDKNMKTIVIDRANLNSRNYYIGNAWLNGNVEIAPNLGLVKFPFGLNAAGCIHAGVGTGIKSSRSVSAGLYIEVGMGISAKWGVQAGTNITTGMGILSNEDVKAGRNIRASQGIKAGGSISAGMDISANEEIRAGAGISAELDITAGDDIIAGTVIEAGWDITASGDIIASLNILAGGDIKAKVISAGEYIEADGVIEATNIFEVDEDLEAAASGMS